MAYVKQKKSVAYDAIQTAWLVLSHGAWVGSALTADGLGLSLFPLFEGMLPREKIKPLSLGCISTGVLLGIWTVYAIAVTWNASRQLEKPIFDDFGFAFLMFVTFAVIGISIWMLVVVGSS